MSEGLPLVVPETNILMDIWLGRDEAVLELFLPFANTGRISLVVPELVLKEFRSPSKILSASVGSAWKGRCRCSGRLG